MQQVLLCGASALSGLDGGVVAGRSERVARRVGRVGRHQSHAPDLSARHVVRVGDIAVAVNGRFDMGRKRVVKVAAAYRAALLASLLDNGATIYELRATNDPLDKEASDSPFTGDG